MKNVRVWCTRFDLILYFPHNQSKNRHNAMALALTQAKTLKFLRSVFKFLRSKLQSLLLTANSSFFLSPIRFTMEALKDYPSEIVIGSSLDSFQKAMESQKHIFHSQIDQLRSIVVVQCKLTGVYPLSQEMILFLFLYYLLLKFISCIRFLA